MHSPQIAGELLKVMEEHYASQLTFKCTRVHTHIKNYFNIKSWFYSSPMSLIPVLTSRPVLTAVRQIGSEFLSCVLRGSERF